MRLNGVKAILEYLGRKSRRTWTHLVREHALPIYRDTHNPSLVWATTEDLDEWSRRNSQKNGHGGNAVK